MSKSQGISRRIVLRGMGTAMALPLLDAMMPRSARAAEASKPPVRMAFLFTANGKHMPDWTPKDEGELKELPSILKPLEAHKSKLLVLSGLTLNGGRALGAGPGDHARCVASFFT